MPLTLWVALGGMVLIIGVLAFLPVRKQPRHTRFRTHVWALEPDPDGSHVKAWYWEVRERHGKTDRLVVCGAAPTWQQAMDDGLYARMTAETGWQWFNHDRTEPQQP